MIMPKTKPKAVKAWMMFSYDSNPKFTDHEIYYTKKEAKESSDNCRCCQPRRVEIRVID